MSPDFRKQGMEARDFSRVRLHQYIGTSFDMTKAEIITAYCINEHIAEKDVLFVDDSWPERKEATQKNIDTITPQQIMLEGCKHEQILPNYPRKSCVYVLS